MANQGLYYWVARGVDDRPVRPDRVRKSVGAENTFLVDLTSIDEAKLALEPIIDKVWRHCDSHGTRGRTVTLKVKYADFKILTRSRTSTDVISSFAELRQVSFTLLSPFFPTTKAIRLLGVSMSSLGEDEDDAPQQMRLSL